MKNNIDIDIDYKAFKKDQQWNRLKGYVTNSSLSDVEIIKQYHQFWNIEKAFRISKTDLRVRSIYHRLEHRIKTHICFAFCSYKIYKELERQLKVKNCQYSVEQVLMELKSIYQAEVILPNSRKKTLVLLPMNKAQTAILKAFNIEI